MSDLIDEFVTELLETGSTGSKDNPDYTPPMYKRTPGKWYLEYDPDKHCTALCVDNPEDNSKNEIHPKQGDLQLMAYSAEMYRLLWWLADMHIHKGAVLPILAKIYIEPDADLNIPEELISEVKTFRNEHIATADI